MNNIVQILSHYDLTDMWDDQKTKNKITLRKRFMWKSRKIIVCSEGYFNEIIVINSSKKSLRTTLVKIRKLRKGEAKKLKVNYVGMNHAVAVFFYMHYWHFLFKTFLLPSAIEFRNAYFMNAKSCCCTCK